MYRHYDVGRGGLPIVRLETSMIDRIKSFAKKNLAGMGMLVAVIVVGGILLSLQGCDPGNMFTAKIPNDVQLKVGAPPRATLNECEVFLVTYRDVIKRDYDKHVAMGQLFAASISDGWQMAGFFQAATNIGLNTAATGGFGGVMGGAGLLSLLTFGTGLLFKGPGTNREKNKSFNEGQKKAIDLLRTLNPNLVLPSSVSGASE